MKKNRFYKRLIFLVLFFGIASPVLSQNSTDWLDVNKIDSVEERRILASLKKERAELQNKKKRVERREKELKLLSEEVENKLQKLKALRQEVQNLFAEKREVEKKRVKKLSRIYQTMDPEKAASALTSVELDLAVAIISKMRSGTAGDILNNMDKKKAAELTTHLSNLENE